MNNINFLGQSNFPLSSDTMQYLQEMLYLSAKCAELGGNTYILSGCEENGLNVSSGIVVVNGEILLFIGGAKQTTVYIKEERRDVNASGYNFPEVYRTRSCEFGLGTDQLTWSSFKRVDTNLALSQKVQDLKDKIDAIQGIPKGLISMWSGSVDAIPVGWGLCDGLQGRPNLAGQFIVGFNQNDEDYNEIGKKGGFKQVSLTGDQNGEHSHGYQGLVYQDNSWKSGGNRTDGYTVYYADRTTASSGAGKPHENRPPYYVLAYIIKL